VWGDIWVFASLETTDATLQDQYTSVVTDMYDVFNESRWKNKCILLRAMKQPAFRDIL
jgi:hypothetical protein